MFGTLTVIVDDERFVHATGNVNGKGRVDGMYQVALKPRRAEIKRFRRVSCSLTCPRAWSLFIMVPWLQRSVAVVAKR